MNPTFFASIVAAAIVVCTLAVLALVYLLVRSRQEISLRRRLDPQLSQAQARDFGTVGSAPMIESMARSGKAIEQMVDTEGESARLLVQAGWRSAKARLFWYAFQAVLPVFFFVLVTLYWTFSESPQRTLHGLLAVIVAAILSFLAPRWILRSAASRRRGRVQREVPLFIHLLVLLFESGLSTRQALQSMVRESGGVLLELGRELDVMLRQVEAGADLSDTLKSTSDVLAVEDLSTVFSVLRQVDRYGGELREPLLETLEVIEERRGYELREKVNHMSGRMTVVMVLFFFPALLIFVAGPAFMGIIKALGDINGR
ncbi:type II secretion system F family protein [Solimonas marina]|uniref:Type II secretion system F family protein n=1 Tax=Solimonas marina TaxID=2714601 RepID=A0A969W8H0_9GAMM|nr:type II secretion system F family protein [Solimonas marina]NKF21423.1 type II secretion system F family protein [Solimonas marina]